MTIILKRHSRGILLQAKGDCSVQVHLGQIIIRTVRQEAGPRETQLKVLKTKPDQGSHQA